MSDFLDRFSLDAIKFDMVVMAGMVFVWFVVWICSLMSIRSQGLSKGRRVFWTLVVTFLPVIGVLLYIPFSFRVENYPDLFIWRRNTGQGKKPAMQR